MTFDKIASAIYNDIMSGLAGMTANPTISLEQLSDEVIEERQAVIKEWWLKGLFKKEDLLKSINCVEIDCADMNKCPKCVHGAAIKTAQHFEIPLLEESIGTDAITYIGATDQSNSFKVYFSLDGLKMEQYKSRPSKKPYVFVDRTPNKNNMHDCWLFGAPFIKFVTVVGIFKDLRQLAEFNCCESPDFTDFGIISSEVKKRLLDRKLKLYRQYLMPPHQTDLSPR